MSDGELLVPKTVADERKKRELEAIRREAKRRENRRRRERNGVAMPVVCCDCGKPGGTMRRRERMEGGKLVLVGHAHEGRC